MLEENYIHEDKTKMLKWENIISDPECINNSFQTMLVGKKKRRRRNNQRKAVVLQTKFTVFLYNLQTLFLLKYLKFVWITVIDLKVS